MVSNLEYSLVIAGDAEEGPPCCLQEAGITVGNPGFQAGGRETDQYPGF
jgi:hypothetical protein